MNSLAPASGGRSASGHRVAQSRGWFRRGRFGAPHWADIRQGAFLDCWFVSALASLLFVGAAPEYGISGEEAYRFGFFREGQPREVTVDGRLKYVAGISVFASSRVAGDIWPGLWEKAYLSLVSGVPGDVPDVALLEAPGLPGDALATLTGLQVATLAGRRGLVDELEARCDFTGRLSVAAVGATSHAVDHRQTALGSSHAYSVLGVVRHAGRRHVLVNDPRGRREVERPLAWEILERTDWLVAEGRAARGEHSGVLPLDEELFAASYRYIDYVAPATPRQNPTSE
ncbi:MAG: C2 family cysteine protease [Polyangiaceae bacterium]